MRRCYKCGVKKYDDNIVCPECEYKITQSIRARKLSNEGLAANLRAMAATGVSQSQYEEEYLQTAAERLEDIPNRPKGGNFEPSRRKGHCIKSHEMIEDRLNCSCGIHWIITGHWDKYNYCPNCGGRIAEMEGKNGTI